MSIRGKEVRFEIDPDLHEKLRLIAEFQDQDLSRIAGRLLEKVIVGEWHEFSLLKARMERSGIARNPAETGGTSRRRAE